MDVVNYARAPMESRINFSKNDYLESPIDKTQMSSYPYSQPMGSLMHAIINSQPNCSFIISNLAQYMSNIGISHWQGIKQVLWYIKGTINTCIQYQRHDDGHILHEFSNADWVGDKDTQKSTSSIVFCLWVELSHGQVKNKPQLPFLV
jgi:hypothetical protein